MKRIIYLVGLIVAVGAIIAAGYYFRYKGGGSFTSTPDKEGTVESGVAPLTLPPPTPTGQKTGTAGVVEKIEVVQGKEPTRFAANGGFNYFIYSATSSAVLYSNGQVAILNQDGAEIVSNTEIEDILQADFSFDGSKLAVVWGKRSAPQASVFDIPTKSWRPLPEIVYSFAWSPRDGRLVYLTKSATTYEMRILDAAKANSKPQTLAPFFAEDIKLSWPRPEQILVFQPPNARTPGSLIGIDLAKRIFLPVVQDQKGLDVVWSGTSNWGLVFESGPGEKGGTLQLIDGGGRILRTMSFITLPEKCVFYDADKKYLVCGVPLNYALWNASPLPDAYLKKEIFSRDWFYKIDTETGEIEVIYDGSGVALDAVNLKIKDGVLYFQNRLDGGLYGIAL
jgi:hypothetical protein